MTQEKLDQRSAALVADKLQGSGKYTARNMLSNGRTRYGLPLGMHTDTAMRCWTGHCTHQVWIKCRTAAALADMQQFVRVSVLAGYSHVLELERASTLPEAERRLISNKYASLPTCVCNSVMMQDGFRLLTAEHGWKRFLHRELLT